MLVHNRGCGGEFIPANNNAVLGGKFSVVNKSKGADEVGHHIAQNAYNKTIGVSRSDGPAVLMSKADHELTRTFKWKGAMTMKTDVGLTARQRMALDVMDIRRNFGTKYNKGLSEAIKYAKTLPEYSK